MVKLLWVTLCLNKYIKDMRLCQCVVLCFSEVADAFAGAAEMSLDLPQYVEADDKVHLIAWQNVKRMECHGVSSTSIPHGDPILLVVHSTTSEPNFHLSDALKAVSQVLGVPSSLVEGLVLKSKMVDWTSCQMVQPLESIPTNLRVEEPCLQHGRVIVAGDFWSQSSFLGCFCSAKAAVRCAVTNLEAKEVMPEEARAELNVNGSICLDLDLEFIERHFL